MNKAQIEMIKKNYIQWSLRERIMNFKYETQSHKVNQKSKCLHEVLYEVFEKVLFFFGINN